MALRLAGEEFSVLQGVDGLGWLRSIEVSDGIPGLKVKQDGASPLFKFYDGASKILSADDGGPVTLGRDISLGGNKLRTTDLELKQDTPDRLGVWGTTPGVYRDLITRNLIVYSTGLGVGLRLVTESSTDMGIYDEGASARRSLSLDSLSFFGALVSQTTDGGLQAKNADGANLLLTARRTGVGIVEVARLQGATEPHFLLTHGKVGSVASLPGASAAFRGFIYRVEGGAGVADAFYICEKNAANAYVWRAI